MKEGLNMRKYEDLRFIHENTMKPRAHYIPYDSLEKALDNNLTLSYAKNMVKKELENALLKLKHDNFEEPQIEEYAEFTEDSDDIVDEAEDSEDEFFEDDITEDLEEEN